jgi:hypothetical protein
MIKSFLLLKVKYFQVDEKPAANMWGSKLPFGVLLAGINNMK